MVQAVVDREKGGKGGYIKGERKRVCTLKNGCEILCKSMVVCL